MPHPRFTIPLGLALVALIALAACGGGSTDPTPAPSLSTPTAESEPEPTPTPEPTVTEEDIGNAVEQAIEEKGTEVTVDDVVAVLADDSDSIRESAEQVLAESLAALESASDGESEDDESDPDVLFPVHVRGQHPLRWAKRGVNSSIRPDHSHTPRNAAGLLLPGRGVLPLRAARSGQRGFREISGTRPGVRRHLPPARSASLR